jgi:hypothetical protein
LPAPLGPMIAVTWKGLIDTQMSVRTGVLLTFRVRYMCVNDTVSGVATSSYSKCAMEASRVLSSTDPLRAIAFGFKLFAEMPSPTPPERRLPSGRELRFVLGEFAALPPCSTSARENSSVNRTVASRASSSSMLAHLVVLTAFSRANMLEWMLSMAFATACWSCSMVTSFMVSWARVDTLVAMSSQPRVTSLRILNRPNNQ